MKYTKLAIVGGMLFMIGTAGSQYNPLNPIGAAYSAKASGDSRPVSSLFTYVESMSALQKKLNAAKRVHQPVMIEFFANWCPYCKNVDQNVLSDATVRERMKSFSTVRVDISQPSDELSNMMETYRVYGVPAMVFYDRNGDLYNSSTLESGITKDALLSTLHDLS